MNNFLKPDRLKIGDAIGIVALARPCNPNILFKSKQELSKKGFKVIEASNLHEKYGYLAGKDEIRAKALMDMFLNKEVKALWCVSGGYGSTRLLELLDFGCIRKNPKIFIGLSDITGMHIPLNSVANMVTFLGPTLSVLYGEDYKLSAKEVEKDCFDFLLSEKEFSIDLDGREDFKVLTHGTSKGRLLGGNLALICSLIGTRFSLNTDGAILLIEDVNEPPYRIDRMLNQLKQAGMLENLKGVILASFHKCDPKNKNSLSLEEVFSHYFSKQNYPVVYGLASGHIENMLTFPLGSIVELDTYSKKLELKESCFSLESSTVSS